MKRAMSILLSLILAVSIVTGISLSVNAAGVEDLTFTLSDDGTYYQVSDCNESAEGALVIPEMYNDLPVKCIDDFAFSGCVGLVSVTISDNVVSLGEKSFYGCTSLTSVTIGKGVKTIGKAAFDNSYYLTNVYISDVAAWCGINFVDWDSNPLVYADNLYLNNEIVKDLVIPEGVTEIPQAAFRNCQSIRSVVIPGTVETIGVVAFENCGSLLFATIGEGVKTIGFRAFAICDFLTTIVIPDSVTTIGDYAFYACRNLNSVSMGKGLTNVGRNAFDECDDIQGVYVADNEAYSNVEFDFGGWPNPVHLALYVCSDDKRSGTLVIPEGVTMIPIWAYYNWDHITSLKIYGEVESIQKGAFENCNNLIDVVIPDSVTTIDEAAFSGCDNLTDVYYTGTEEQWKAVSISQNNQALLDAKIHYNYCEHDFSTPIYTAPPCTANGYTIYECHCGASRLADFVDVTGHIDSDGNGVCDQCEKILDGSVANTPSLDKLSMFGVIIELFEKILDLFNLISF